jgi:hypothetical protein
MQMNSPFAFVADNTQQGQREMFSTEPTKAAPHSWPVKTAAYSYQPYKSATQLQLNSSTTFCYKSWYRCREGSR